MNKRKKQQQKQQQNPPQNQQQASPKQTNKNQQQDPTFSTFLTGRSLVNGNNQILALLTPFRSFFFFLYFRLSLFDWNWQQAENLLCRHASRLHRLWETRIKKDQLTFSPGKKCQYCFSSLISLKKSKLTLLKCGVFSP